jgi:uncharacterized protein (TIGR02118 family)
MVGRNSAAHSAECGTGEAGWRNALRLFRPTLFCFFSGEDAVIKSLSLLTRRPELTHEEFCRHWVETHAPLAHAVPGVRRYVQNHIVGERSRADIATTAVAVDGIAELWYDDRAAMERANASPEAKHLHDDGALFIGGIKTFIIEESVVIPKSG